MKKKTATIIRYLSILLFIVAGAMAAGSASAEDILKIGIIAPMTGPAAETGEGMKNASILAADEINQSGGILGRKIKLFFGDDESKPAAGASVMERLINSDKVDIIVGTMNSNVGLATMEIAANYQIPFVATCPAAQSIADKIKNDPKRYKYILKPDITATAHTVGAATAAEMIAKEDPAHSKKRTAVFLTEQTDWGAAVEGAADAEFSKVGWKVIDKQKHDIGETNYLSLLAKIKASDAELLVTAETSASAASSIAKQFLEQGIKMYLVQIYGPAKPGYLEALGGGVDGLISEQMIACHTKQCDEFSNKFTKRFGAPKFDVCGNMQYDMMYLVKQAYEKAGSFDKDKWIKATLETRLPGTVGIYEFDPQYHDSKVGKEYIPTLVYQLQKGKWEYLSPEYMKTTKFMVPAWLK